MSSSDGEDDQPSDQMRDRGAQSSWKLWFLMDANRIVVSGVFLAVVFVTMVVGATLNPTPAYALLTNGDPTDTLFNALVGSTITGVTLVLTLSQLVLSQELGAAGDQRERMEGAMDFRRDAASAAGIDVAPTEPSAFLRGLVEGTRDKAGRLADAVPDDDSDASDVVDTYVDDLTENADQVAAELEGAEFGEFDVVWAALNYNYSWKIYAGERIRAEYGEALSEDATEALAELLDLLELFGPAREHFKTLYFQWELSDLSRVLLYAAVPALAVAIFALVFFDPSNFPGHTLGVNHAVVVVSAATTVAVVPFVLLLAYILRIVTVTKRTLSIGPFILRKTSRSEDIEWN
ncbi:hypothetical protein [Halobacterium zhouii]|uniref:hypothetical protein n=1 Tax=Halobacterium zhouii TaxID=2902624 RepID=UPI001E2CFFA0|nr:hypothetical protein [Halobacterium zhouii]